MYWWTSISSFPSNLFLYFSGLWPSRSSTHYLSICLPVKRKVFSSFDEKNSASPWILVQPMWCIIHWHQQHHFRSISQRIQQHGQRIFLRPWAIRFSMNFPIQQLHRFIGLVSIKSLHLSFYERVLNWSPSNGNLNFLISTINWCKFGREIFAEALFKFECVEIKRWKSW